MALCALLTCAPDTLIWSFLHMLINTILLSRSVANTFPLLVKRRLRNAYSFLFKPLGVSQKVFNELTEFGEILEIEEDGVYAMEDVTNCDDRISLLVSGRFKVTSSKALLHYVIPNHFLDSLEYENTRHQRHRTALPYQVSITAVQDSFVLTWQLRPLNRYLKRNPTLKNVFLHIIGADITRKIQEQCKLEDFIYRNTIKRTSELHKQYLPRMKSTDLHSIPVIEILTPRSKSTQNVRISDGLAWRRDELSPSQRSASVHLQDRRKDCCTRNDDNGVSQESLTTLARIRASRFKYVLSTDFPFIRSADSERFFDASGLNDAHINLDRSPLRCKIMPSPTSPCLARCNQTNENLDECRSFELVNSCPTIGQDPLSGLLKSDDIPKPPDRFL
ncbi:uncharacterized protein LOC141905468 [Tubulanus polymorphus]|uniref:uncharacterized protein LOC141905468 n=1 Tax=Tubulanus polymorphus TaxID=672921 RepID=UPI003DA5B2B0